METDCQGVHKWNKVGNHCSNGKCILTVFWDYKGNIQQLHIKGMIINANTYKKTLKRFKQWINVLVRE